MEVERSSSRPAHPASASRETKLQHLAAFGGGRRALAMTGLTIHDNVMRELIPAAGLLQ
jgi:hypothetical protein